jgi:hypothetical protein
MAVEMEDVRALLDPEEPDYEAVSALGEDAAPYLDELASGDDPMLASKAAYAAGLVGGDGATAAVAHAAEHHDPVVRVAAAAAAANLTSPAASDVLETLVVDVDPGVRKVARSSVPEEASEALELRLQELPEESPEGGSEQPDISAMGTPMPGETPSLQQMPGESSGLMPGEEATDASGADRPPDGEMPR